MARLQPQDVINAFLNLETLQVGRLMTDGQSLYSSQLRIAEHIPVGRKAVTLVYDYTENGGHFQSEATSYHVRLVRRAVPRRNLVSVQEAVRAGLVK